jgi:hypothetical protein
MIPAKLPGEMAVPAKAARLSPAAEKIRAYVERRTTDNDAPISQVALANKAVPKLHRTWLNSFLRGAYRSIDVDKVQALAKGLDMDVVTFLQAAGVAVPLRSDLVRVLEAAKLPKNAEVLHVLDLDALLKRRPLLDQLMVILQSIPDDDLKVVVKMARGIAAAATDLDPSLPWESAKCQRCGTVFAWWPGFDDVPGDLCAACKREADRSTRIGVDSSAKPRKAAKKPKGVKR